MTLEDGKNPELQGFDEARLPHWAMLHCYKTGKISPGDMVLIGSNAQCKSWELNAAGTMRVILKYRLDGKEVFRELDLPAGIWRKCISEVEEQPILCAEPAVEPAAVDLIGGFGDAVEGVLGEDDFAEVYADDETPLPPY